MIEFKVHNVCVYINSILWLRHPHSHYERAASIKTSIEQNIFLKPLRFNPAKIFLDVFLLPLLLPNPFAYTGKKHIACQ